MENKEKTSSIKKNNTKKNELKDKEIRIQKNVKKNKVEDKIAKEKKEKKLLKEVKEEIRKDEDNKLERTKINRNLKLEKIFSIIVAIIFIILLILSFSMIEFIPATLITLTLEIYSIAYIISEKNEKDKKIYILFTIGTIILFAAVLYTIIKINN